MGTMISSWQQLPTMQERWQTFRAMIAAELPKPVHELSHERRFHEPLSPEEVHQRSIERGRIYRRRKHGVKKSGTSSAGRNA